MEKVFGVSVCGPYGGQLKVELSERELRGMIRDSLEQGVRASMAIEGLDVPDSLPAPPLESIPEELLAT